MQKIEQNKTITSPTIPELRICALGS